MYEAGYVSLKLWKSLSKSAIFKVKNKDLNERDNGF